MGMIAGQQMLEAVCAALEEWQITRQVFEEFAQIMADAPKAHRVRWRMIRRAEKMVRS